MENFVLVILRGVKMDNKKILKFIKEIEDITPSECGDVTPLHIQQIWDKISDIKEVIEKEIENPKLDFRKVLFEISADVNAKMEWRMTPDLTQLEEYGVIGLLGGINETLKFSMMDDFSPLDEDD